MLDIIEVMRRAQMADDGGDISHEFIVSPLVGTLLDPEYHGETRTVLLTAPECIMLGQLLEGQACALDEAEAGCYEGLALSQALHAKLTRMYYCAAYAWCFLAGFVLGAMP